MGSISLALAALNTRRAIASAAVLGFFLITGAMAGLLQSAAHGAAQRFAVLLSPVNAANGVVGWIFQVPPPPKLPPASAVPLSGPVLLAGVAAWTAASLLVLFARYRKVSA
jgi:hypothetical protein